MSELHAKIYDLTLKLEQENQKIKQLSNKVYFEKTSKTQLKELVQTLRENSYISPEAADILRVNTSIIILSKAVSYGKQYAIFNF